MAKKGQNVGHPCYYTRERLGARFDELEMERVRKISDTQRGRPSPLKNKTYEEIGGSEYAIRRSRALSKKLKGRPSRNKGLVRSPEVRERLKCPPNCTCSRHVKLPETKKKLHFALLGKNKGKLARLYGDKISEGVVRYLANLSEEERNERVRKAKQACGRNGPNGSELKLLFLLEELRLPYAYNGNAEILIVGGKASDYVNVNGQKKLVELYGDYWHRGDNPQKRIDYFAKFGFQTLVIWEHELADPEAVKQKLLEFERL